jgi:hypothetical protein
MPSSTGFVKRLITGGLAITIFTANVAFVHSAETNFWAERRAAARRSGQTTLLAMASVSDLTGPSLVPEISHGLSTPFSQSLADKPAKIARSFNLKNSAPSADWLRGVLSYGDIGDHFVSPNPNAPLVIHIQDAHGIKEAQQNIASMIGALQSSRGVNLVGVEGAAGIFNLVPYRAYPSQVVKDVADFFLDRGLIVGSEYAGLTLPKSLTLFGMEHGSLYAENATALRESYAARSETRSVLERLQGTAKTLKQKRYSPALLEYDTHMAAYKAERESLSDFVKFLAHTYKPHSKALPALGANVAMLLTALELESSLDFKQVESDRARLVETLVGRLNTQSLQDLVDKSVAYRSGSMGYGEYYSHLLNVCEQTKVNLKKYGQLPTYINYVIAAEKIDKSHLITELDQLETNAQDALITTEGERRLVADSRLLDLLDKLIHHEMTPSDWTRYNSLRARVADLPARLEMSTMPLPNLAPFELFCSKAIARNNAMVDRLLEKMRADNTNTALMVAGGFHTEGMTQLLRQNNISYLVVTPKIKDVPKESDYLDVLARAPAPLEKIIAGEKIFLVKWLAIGGKNAAVRGITGTQSAGEVFLKLEDLLVGKINNFMVGKVMFRLTNSNKRALKLGDKFVESIRVDGWERAEKLAHYALKGIYQAVPATITLLALGAFGPLVSALVFIVSAHLFSLSFAMAHQTDNESSGKLYRLNLLTTASLLAALLLLPTDPFMSGQIDLAKSYSTLGEFLAAFLSLSILPKLWTEAIEWARTKVKSGNDTSWRSKSGEHKTSNIPGATVSMRKLIKTFGFQGNLSQIARAENLLTAMISTSLALSVFNLVMFVAYFFGVDFSEILTEGPSKDYFFPAMGYIFGLLGSQQVTKRVFNYFHGKGISIEDDRDLLSPNPDQIKAATKTAMSSFYYGVPLIFAGILMIHLGWAVPGHLMILAIGLIYSGFNIGKVVHVFKNNVQISNFDLISSLFILIPLILWEECIILAPSSFLWIVGGGVVVLILVGLLAKEYAVSHAILKKDDTDKSRRKFLKSISFLVVGAAVSKISPAAQNVTAGQSLEQYFVDILSGDIKELTSPSGDYYQHWVPSLNKVNKEYARALIRDQDLFADFRKMYRVVLGMAREKYSVSNEFSDGFITVMLACLWTKTDVLKRSPSTAPEALRAYLSDVLLNDAVIANNFDTNFWNNTMLNHPSIKSTPYAKELKKDQKLLAEMLELTKKIVIEVIGELQSKTVNNPIFIATMLRTLITKYFVSSAEKAKPPRELSPSEMFKRQRQPSKRVFGSAGMTKWMLTVLGLPGGSKSIGFVEGVPTGALAGVMAAAPLLLSAAVAAWMGVDISPLIQNDPVMTLLLWAFLSAGGVFISQRVTRLALFSLHEKTGVVMEDGIPSFVAADARAATETAMSSFYPGGYAAPVLATVALINPPLVGLSLSLMGGIVLLSGIVHAVKNELIAKAAFKNNYKTNRVSVDNALKQFLGRQLIDSLGKPGRVLPYSLNPFNPVARGVRSSFAEKVDIAGVDDTSDLIDALNPVAASGITHLPTIHTYDLTPLTKEETPSNEKIILVATILSDIKRYQADPSHSFAFVSTDRTVRVENVLNAIRTLPKISEESLGVLAAEIKTISTPREGETQIELARALKNAGMGDEIIKTAIHRIVANPSAIIMNGISVENIIFLNLKNDLMKTVIQGLEAMMETDDDA